MAKMLGRGIATVTTQIALLLLSVAPAGAISMGVTGEWDFTYGDLRATSGSDLQFVGDSATFTTFPTLNVNGEQDRVMAFGAYSGSEGILLHHGAQPNGGGQFVNQYTIIMDVMYPSSSSDLWRALVQTDPFNHPGDDAEFYVGDRGTLPSPDGLGTGNQFDATLAPDTWYRIAFAVDLTAANGQQLTKYVNGVKVASQALPGGVDGRYALGPTAQLFTTGVGPGFTEPGYVRGIQFVNGCMTSNAIAALGGFVLSTVLSASSSLQIATIYPSGSSVFMNWTGGTAPFQVQAAALPFSKSWQNVGNPVTNRSLTFSVPGALRFFRVLGSPTQNSSPTPTVVNPMPLSQNPLPVMVDAPPMVVNSLANGAKVLPTSQLILPAGKRVEVGNRPLDLVRSADGTRVFIKNISSLQIMDATGWTLRQSISYPAEGASMHGLAISPDGRHVYVTGARNSLYDFVSTNSSWAWSRTITLPDYSDPCGIAISADGTKAYVCLGINNSLAVVSLTSGTLLWQINVGIAPWDVVLSPDGSRAYVSDWGGRRPVAGDLTATSAGTQVVVDNRGVGASGVASIVDLTQNTETTEIPTGLHPSALALSADGSRLYVANANSDSVTAIDTHAAAVRETVLIRPDPALPFFGTDPQSLALSPDGTRLYVAAAGNNGVAVLELPNSQHTNSLILGFIPTDWYPGSVVVDSNYVYVANMKGVSSLPGNLMNYRGTANRVPVPAADTLNKYTAQVQENGRLPQMFKTQAAAQAGATPVPVPQHVGEPSVFQHVVYIIKENKTYDYVLGDVSQGNGNSNLCVFPQFVSPNHHALAAQYVLLDNYYCNGVLSADGHSWCVEAHVTDHIERSFGGFARSYTLGTDPLTYSSSGFIWNNALSHGVTFRNYGELFLGWPTPGATWLQSYSNYTSQAGQIRYINNTGVAPLIPYTSTNVPGWNLNIPDAIRADGFIRELNAAQSNGVWAALHVLYLPNDHTAGATAGYPTPRAMMADNDLALGRVVEAITKSSFAGNTCIFVIEDDPQNGPDHVDGHRSFCLVISPYTKRGQTVSTFYNQTGVVHTMEQMLGLPPMNQQDAMAPLLTDCFTNVPNFTPYTALANNIPLNEMNPGTTGSLLNRTDRYWAKKSQHMDFSKPDLVDENALNRVIWHSVKGDVHYPSEFAGPHGKGLKKLGLMLDKNQKVDDDD